MLCTILVYVPLSTYDKSKTLREFYDSAQEVKPVEEKMGEMVRTAYAALEINKVMEAAQNAANMYLDEIREMKKETEAQCIHVLKITKEKADEYLSQFGLDQQFDEE